MIQKLLSNTQFSNNMGDIFKNAEEYNPNKNKKY